MPTHSIRSANDSVAGGGGDDGDGLSMHITVSSGVFTKAAGYLDFSGMTIAGNK